MNYHQALILAFDIKANPEAHRQEFANYLYEAVGMVKLEKHTGATMAAAKLASEIIRASGGKLSDFCKRKIEIIEKAHLQNMVQNYSALLKAQEIVDYNKQMEDMCRDEEGDIF